MKSMNQPKILEPDKLVKNLIKGEVYRYYPYDTYNSLDVEIIVYLGVDKNSLGEEVHSFFIIDMMRSFRWHDQLIERFFYYIRHV